MSFKSYTSCVFGEDFPRLGKKVYDTTVDIEQGLRKEFDLNVNSGMYLIKLKGAGFETTKRIIIK
jgi:hypothetical protein